MTVLYNMVFKEVISCEDGQRNSLALVTAGSWLCRFNEFSVILLLSFSRWCQGLGRAVRSPPFGIERGSVWSSARW